MDESSDAPVGEPNVSKEAAGDQAIPAAKAVSSQGTGPSDSASIQQVRDLLRAKDDTSRFVALALLKSLLDNSVEFREDKETISALWDCISPKFLDRLLKSGGAGRDGKGSQKRDGQDLLDLAVTVLHTFTALLPDQVKREMRLLGRIPTLTASVLHRQVTCTASSSAYAPSETNKHTARRRQRHSLWRPYKHLSAFPKAHKYSSAYRT